MITQDISILQRLAVYGKSLRGGKVIADSKEYIFCRTSAASKQYSDRAP